MNILYLSSEAVPFAKTGGLGDVAGVLPRLLAQSANVSLMLPDYMTESIKGSGALVVDRFPLTVGTQDFEAVVKKTVCAPGFSVYFIANDLLFGREGLYGDAAGDYGDNFIRFLFFQKAVMEHVRREQLSFDIIHCNDWQTALVPLFVNMEPRPESLRRVKTVFSIHNLGYQGIFPAAAFAESELPGHLFSAEYLEFYGNLNCMKAGIIFSDRLLTVSPTYAREIVGAEKGFGLDGLLAKFSSKLSGILNGVDYSLWDPRNDPFIEHRYSAAALAGKKKNKQALYKELAIAAAVDSPLLVMISRISAQKGVDLLLELLPALLQEDLHFIFLGVGDRAWTGELGDVAGRFPQRMTFLNCFDEKLAHRLEAAADMLFMPSSYEPCGLNQIYSLRYGTVPVVRATGGLEDSVQEFDPQTRQGTGFKFKGSDAAGVLAVIRRALRMFADRDLWRKLQENGMGMDFSWERVVPHYFDLYKKMLSEDAQHV
ncbi:MAG: glycogen synthase GlgA [Acidobacteria bacterium]|nr:glycogen synthase GlgA [Acidobacteriota bacterium]